MFLFFFNDTATTEIYTLSLHDALPIFCLSRSKVPMTNEPLVNLSSLIDDAKCFDLVRQHRWPNGVRCPTCGSADVTRHGRDDTQPDWQRYRCKGCEARFDDLTDTIFAGHHRRLQASEIGRASCRER